MGRFEALTPLQDDVIRRLVAFSRKCSAERFLSTRSGDGCEVHPLGKREGSLLLPCAFPPYEPLTAAGLLLPVGAGPYSETIHLLQAAFDYADYPRRGLGRFLRELAWDMAHDAGFRARFVWMLITLTIGGFIAYAIDLLPHP